MRFVQWQVLCALSVEKGTATSVFEEIVFSCSILEGVLMLVR